MEKTHEEGSMKEGSIDFIGLSIIYLPISPPKDED